MPEKDQCAMLRRNGDGAGDLQRYGSIGALEVRFNRFAK